MKKVTAERPGAGSDDARRPASWCNISLIANITIAVIALVGGVILFLLHQSDTNPGFCALCHNMRSHVDSYLHGNTMDNIHARANVECKQCHDYGLVAEATSLVKFVTGNYDNPVPRRKYDQPMCTQCHLSLDYHAARTDFLRRNPHASHWPELKCTTCHLSHADQVDYCSQCHDNGGQRVTAGPIVPRAENPWANASY